MRKGKFYKEFKESLNSYIEFFNSDKGKMIFSKENFAEENLQYVCLYDSFDNNGIRQLIKNIYSLSKNDFDVTHTSYIYSRKGQYLKFQDLSSSHGIFADIKVNNDRFINEINLSWCQRSNYTAFLEYQLVFHNVFESFRSEYDFIIETLQKLKRDKINYFKRFEIRSESFKHETGYYLESHNNLFKYAVQKYIEDALYTKIEKKYDLMTLYVYSVKELNKEATNPPYMGLIGRHKKYNTVFFIDRNPSTFEPVFDVEVVTSSRNFEYRSIMTYFSQYRNILYYSLYFYQELNVLNNQISGYNLGAKKVYNFKNLLWLYRKIAELESSRDSGETIDVVEINNKLNENWTIEYGTYEGDNPVAIPFEFEFSRSNIEFILKKYKEQYDLYKVALEAQTNRYNTRVAFISLGLAILAILISIIFPFIF